ncbi:MAG: ribonuclease PH [Myxococcales bacterium]|nr:MAG: ribonuclease PH [Myxococcales bacterium]
MHDDGRADNALRPATIQTGIQKYPDGSVLIACGETKVICAAHAESRVPPFLSGSGQGWITAEYAMLPGAGQGRTARERNLGGRSAEIQRLIGRSLRAVCDLAALGEQTITVDCDVLQADGGTRTASITGAFVAVTLAIARLRTMGLVAGMPFVDSVQAISCGVVDGRPLLDLAYSEDVRAEVDMNVVMTGSGRLIEVQGTAERAPFGRDQLDQLLTLSEAGCRSLKEIQRQALGKLYDEIAARHA